MAGNICSCLKGFAKEHMDNLLGRKFRFLTEGLAGNGKVYEDPKPKHNKENLDGQTEKHYDPSKGRNTIGESNYNPDFFSLVPKVNKRQVDPNDPNSDIEVEGKVAYNPFGDKAKKDDSETEEMKKRKIEEEKRKHQKEIDDIRNRLNINTLDKLVKDHQEPVNNDLTNNKPDPQPTSGNQVAPGMANPSAPAPSWGQEAQKIPGLNLSSTDAFPNDSSEDNTRHSSEKVVIPDSSWSQVHSQIQGEFYDKDFTPDKVCLYGRAVRTDRNAKYYDRMARYDFKRLSYLMEGLSVVSDGMTPSDIYQGSIGDCYFLSSIAAIAENPKRLERLFFQDTVSPKGAYCVALNIVGVWVPVVIDDIFPTQNGEIAHCYTKTKEIWAMLLEKAYAKAFGSYVSIGCGGLCFNALKDLTGAPCEYLLLDDAEEQKKAMNTIVEADRANYIITCGSKGQGEAKNPNGIISGHAYTLISTLTLPNGQVLVKLRNPWGSGEWKGDYSDDSPLWTPDLKARAGWTSEDDGSFFMPFEAMLDNYDQVSICHYRDHYIYSYLQSRSESGEVDIKQFSVSAPGEYYVGVSQPDSNMWAHDPNYELGFISCLVARKDGSRVTYIDGFSNNTRDPWIKAHLEPGAYVAIVFTKWESANTDYTFWTYGPKNTVIKTVSRPENKRSADEILIEALKQHAFSDDSNWNNFSNPKLSNARYKFEHCSNGYGYYIFDNQVQGLTLTAKLTKESTACDYIYPVKENSQGYAELTINYGECKLVVYRVMGIPNSVGFKCGFSMSLRG